MGEEEHGCRGIGHLWHHGPIPLFLSPLILAATSICPTWMNLSLGFTSGTQSHP